MEVNRKAFGRSICAGLAVLCGTAQAAVQTGWEHVAQNPLADVMKLSVDNRFEQGYGHADRTKYVLGLRPSFVSALSEEWKMVNRLALPIIYQPASTPGENVAFGLGDTTYESFYAPTGQRTFQWGAGPTFRIPTATDNPLGSRKWSAGLAGTGLFEIGPVVAGLRANHLWSFAGKSDRPDVNLSSIEYFAYLNLGDGWWLGTDPVNTANWEAPQDERWTVPVGGGIGRVIMRGRQPVNLSLEAYTYAESNSMGPDWTVQLGIQLLFPEELLFRPPSAH
jgi:hypothetical protein